MAKQKKKSDLQQKICENCNKSFTWRKKWEKVWKEVKYCSERCRIEKRKIRHEESSKLYVQNDTPLSKKG